MKHTLGQNFELRDIEELNPAELAENTAIFIINSAGYGNTFYARAGKLLDVDMEEVNVEKYGWSYLGYNLEYYLKPTLSKTAKYIKDADLYEAVTALEAMTSMPEMDKKTLFTPFDKMFDKHKTGTKFKAGLHAVETIGTIRMDYMKKAQRQKNQKNLQLAKAIWRLTELQNLFIQPNRISKFLGVTKGMTKTETLSRAVIVCDTHLVWRMIIRTDQNIDYVLGNINTGTTVLSAMSKADSVCLSNVIIYGLIKLKNGF